MWSLIQDLRFGARMLAKRPGTAAIAIVALALGIGLTTTMFSVVNGVFLRGLPFERADQLVYVGAVNTKNPGRPNQMTSVEFLDLVAQQRSFEALAAFSSVSVDIAAPGGAPFRYDGQRLAPNVLHVLRMPPALGRDFTDADAAVGAAPVALISHQVWTTQFASRPDVVGTVVSVNRQPTTIVGVMPPRFGFPDSCQVWLPLTVPAAVTRANAPRVSVFGRLRADATLAQANQELSLVAVRLQQQYTENKDRTLSAIPLMRRFIADAVINLLSTMLAAVFGVLLIACVNVTNLQLARASERTREVAVRLALGASRARVVRQLLCEGVILSAIGATIGVGLAVAGVALINVGISADDTPPFWIDIRVDARVLLFATALTAIAAIASTLLPALRLTRGTLVEAINDDSRSSTSLRVGRMSRGLVVAQVALSFSLLLGSGLIVKSIAAISAVVPPYRTNIFAARFDGSVMPRETPAFEALLERVSTRVTEVTQGGAVTFATGLPNLGAGSRTVEIEGIALSADNDRRPSAERIAVDGRYFSVMGLQMIQGRALSAVDRRETEPVAVVSEDFGTRFVNGGNPIGRRIRFFADNTPTPWITVVGTTSRAVNLARSGAPTPTIFVPLSQSPNKTLDLLVAGTGALTSGPAISRAIAEIDPTIVVYNATTVQGRIDRQTWATRVFGGLFTAFGVSALLLASVGLYGVMAFGVRRRTPEIGVRMALGARPVDIMRMVIRQGGTLLAIGLVLGLAAGLLLSQQLTQLLFQVAPWDPTVIAATFIVLAGTGFIACGVPARRASAIDPLMALRRD